MTLNWFRRVLDDKSYFLLVKLLEEEGEIVEKYRKTGMWLGDKVNKELPYYISPLSEKYLSRAKSSFIDPSSISRFYCSPTCEIKFGASIIGFVPEIYEDEVVVKPVTIECVKTVVEMKRTKKFKFIPSRRYILEEIYESDKPFCIRTTGSSKDVQLFIIHRDKVMEYQRKINSRLGLKPITIS